MNEEVNNEPGVKEPIRQDIKKEHLLKRIVRKISRRSGKQFIKESKNPEIQVKVAEKRAELENKGIDAKNANEIARAETAKEIRIERLKEEAKYIYEDPLTGLRSRRWVMEQIPVKAAIAERSKSPLYAILMDMDDFKQFNTYYDHVGGDEILKLFKELPTREDEPLGRYGGDEFFQLVNRDITEEDLNNIIERYKSVMLEASRVKLSGLNIVQGESSDHAPKQATLSFGIAKYQGETPEEFIKKTAAALLESKKQGKNMGLIAETGADGRTLSFKSLGGKKE